VLATKLTQNCVSMVIFMCQCVCKCACTWICAD